VSRFIDAYLDEQVPGFPCISSPRWSTNIQIVDSGVEQISQRWVHPLHTYALPDAIREHATFNAVHKHWMVMRGPAYTFPFRDPLDFASVDLELPNVEPTLSRTDQIIGTGDGISKVFQLTKTYTVGAQSYARNIYHPVVSSVLIGVNGEDPNTASPNYGYSIDRGTGVVTFEVAPDSGDVITAGFYYDVEVRFADDNAFDGIVRTYNVSGFADIELAEVRPCS
jgi:uncharacterized protein (TIGR02217 family)